MDYVEPAAARDLPGLRIALTRDLPAPYSMSARAILDHHQVPYVAVSQRGGQANDDLVAWTRHRNAPVAVYNDEAPRTTWIEILYLAERLGRGPSLIPADRAQRIQMFGLAHELIGEGGFIWHARIVMLGLGGPERAAEAARTNPMYAQYGYSEAARASSLTRARDALDALAVQARAQQAAGSPYLIGTTFSALDIYWAYFSQLARTLSEEQCPMPRGMRKSYDLGGAALGDVDPVLIAQRDGIFARHLPLPMTF